MKYFAIGFYLTLLICSLLLATELISMPDKCDVVEKHFDGDKVIAICVKEK